MVDEDILFAMISSLQTKVDSIESDVSSIKTYLPETGTIEYKLDEIILLLKKILNK